MLLIETYLNRRLFLRRLSPPLTGAALSLLPLPAVAAAADLKKLITQYYADYAALDLEKVLSHYAADCYFEDPTFHITLRSREEIRARFAPLKQLYQKVKFEPELLLVSGHWLISRHAQSGTLRRALSAEFIAYRVQGLSLFEFAGGQIKRQYDYYDALGLRKQIGVTGGAQ